MATDTIISIKVPAAGESVTEAIIGTWTKGDGEYVHLDEVIVELESDKATMELPAEAAGKLKILVDEGETVDVGSIIAEIDTSAKAPEKSPEPQVSIKEEKNKKEAIPETPSSKTNKVNTDDASPAAKKIMQENGVDSNSLNGSGKSGRITKQDVLDHLKSPKTQGAVHQNSIKSSFSSSPKKITLFFVAFFIDFSISFFTSPSPAIR